MRRSIILAGIVLSFFLTIAAQEPQPATPQPPANQPAVTPPATPPTNAVPTVVTNIYGEVKTRVVTLDECIQMALKHNFVIKIEEYAPQLVGYNLSGAYGAYDPMFRVTAQHQNSSSEGGIDQNNLPIPNSTRETDSIDGRLGGLLPSGLTYELSGGVDHSKGDRQLTSFDQYSGSAGAFVLEQPFLRDFWIDNTRRGIAVLKKDLQISELQFRFTVMDIVTQVELAYREYMFGLTNIVVAQDALTLAERSVYEVKKKVEVGQLAELEQKSADAEVQRARADLITANYNAQVQENTLKSLITDNYAELHPVKLLPAEKLNAQPVVIDLGATWLEALRKRPDYKQQLLALDKANITLKYSRNQLFPFLNAFGSYGHTGFADARPPVHGTAGDVLEDLRRGNTPQSSYGLSLRFPLSFRSERNAFKTAKVTREQEELRTKQLENGILLEIDNAVNRVKSSFEAISATRQARIFAEAALDAEQKKFENGKSTTFNVLQFQRDLTAARRDEIRSLVDYSQSLADLEFRKGSTLETRGIAIKVE
jgi:outer membrane protein TolC